MLFFSEGFAFRNFLADAFAVFMFVLWFWGKLTDSFTSPPDLGRRRQSDLRSSLA